MAKLGSLNNTLHSAWDEYKGWFIVGLFAYILFSLRGVFSALGDAATAGAQAATAGITKSATTSADKTKAQAAAGTKVQYTDQQVATFRQDATNLAEYLGRGPGVGLQNIFKDQKSAFSLLKLRYARLNLYNNKPWKWVTINGKKTIQSQSVETTESVRNTTNWKVLIPFYKEVSGGHSLEADVRYYVTDSSLTPYLKWIL